jgi:hypothetical protein
MGRIGYDADFFEPSEQRFDSSESIVGHGLHKSEGGARLTTVVRDKTVVTVPEEC